MEKSNILNLNNESSPFEKYLRCLSYCDIHAKGIDYDCETTCIERHLKSNN